MPGLRFFHRVTVGTLLLCSAGVGSSAWAGGPRQAAELQASGQAVVADGDLIVQGSGRRGPPLDVLLQLPDVTRERLEVVDSLREQGAALVRVPADAVAADVLTRLNRVRGLHAFPNARARPSASGVVLDPAAGGADPAVAAVARLADAWRGAPGAAPVRVAVIDTGIAWKGDDRLSTFGPRVRFEAPYDALTPGGDATDRNQHGTYLTSVAAAAINGPVTFIPVRALDENGDGHEFAVAKGLLHAVVAGADVINLSLTFGPEYTPSDLMVDALLAAEEAGVVVVAATGNDGDDSVGYPAAFPTVLAVGATDLRGRPTSYGNAGPAMDLVAPGGGDDAAVSGVPARTIAWQRPGVEGIVLMSGTSTAAAVVTGVAALMRAHSPALDAAAVRNLLVATARDVGPRGFDSVGGAGVVDAGRALRAAGHAARWPNGSAGRAAMGEALAANVSPFIEAVIDADGKEARRMVALVQVFDASRRAVRRATVHVAILGSARESVRCVTDASGRCVVEGAPIQGTAGEALLFAARVDRVVRGRSRVTIPLPAVHLGRSRVEELVDKQGPATTLVVASFDGGVPGRDSLLAGRKLEEAYTARSLGHAHLGSEMVFVFDRRVWQSVRGDCGVATIAGGMVLASTPGGEPLFWANDAADGTGFMASGMVIVGRADAPTFDRVHTQWYGSQWQNVREMVGATSFRPMILFQQAYRRAD